jgi:hypothetical protein
VRQLKKRCTCVQLNQGWPEALAATAKKCPETPTACQAGNRNSEEAKQLHGEIRKRHRQNCPSSALVLPSHNLNLGLVLVASDRGGFHSTNVTYILGFVQFVRV